MVEELDTHSGITTSVNKKILRDVKSGEPFGIPNAEKASTTLDAVSAHLTVLSTQSILEFLAKKTHTAEAGVKSLAAHQALRNQEPYATLLAKLAITVMAQSVGKIAQQVNILAVPSAQTQPMHAPRLLSQSQLTCSEWLRSLQPLLLVVQLTLSNSLKTWVALLSSLQTQFVILPLLSNSSLNELIEYKILYLQSY